MKKERLKLDKLFLFIAIGLSQTTFRLEWYDSNMKTQYWNILGK